MPSDMANLVLTPMLAHFARLPCRDAAGRDATAMPYVQRNELVHVLPYPSTAPVIDSVVFPASRLMPGHPRPFVNALVATRAGKQRHVELR